MTTSVISGLLKTVDTIFGITKQDKLDELLSIVKDNDKRNIAYANGNVIQLIKGFIVEPVIIVSSDLTREQEIQDVIKMNLNLFTSVYMQALQYLVTLHDMKPTVAIDLLSSSSGNFGLGFSQESLNGMLEANVDFDTLNFTEEKSTSVKRTELSEVPSIVNTYDVKVEGKDNNGNSVSVLLPVTIKAKIIYGNEADILNLVEYNSDRKGFFNRLDDVRAGTLSIGELFTMSDIMKDLKNKKLSEDTLFSDLLDSRIMNSVSKIGSAGAVGFGMYYQMLIVSDRVSKLIESRVNGKIVSDRYKEKLLEQIKSMAITVVDTINKRASLHVTQLSGYTDISFKQLKKSGKGDDVTDVLKAVIAGKML